MRRLILSLAALILIVSSFAASLGVQYAYRCSGPLPTARAVVVPHGGASAVASALVVAHVIKHPLLFRAAVLLTRPAGPIHAAELMFPAHASLRDTLLVLRDARPIQHYVTIPEGLSATQIANLINLAPALTGKVAPAPEGTLLPETYAYEYGAARSAIIDRATKAQEKILTQIWAARPPALGLTTPGQAVTLASMIEHETSVAQERPHVAAVFLNRLRLGMKLQSDPTVVYGITGGRDGLDHRLTKADLQQDTPYNTYTRTGLPAGPIDNPGSASLRAALNPAASSDLYFVATGQGGHAFAATIADHHRNVVRYRNWLQQKSIDKQAPQ
jgi:UPF0755 protein